jgi:hypothetical protein
LGPINAGLITLGSATNLTTYVNNEYKLKYLPKRAKPVQDCYASLIDNHLIPAFGRLALRELTPGTLQGYFANRAGGAEFPTLLKIRDTLSSILRSAIHGRFITTNPMDGLELPLPTKDRAGGSPQCRPKSSIL